MPHPTKRTAFLLDAISIALKPLADMPDSAAKEQIIAEAKVCVEAIERWAATSPTPGEREGVTKRVLRLHVTVARLRAAGTRE